MTRTLVWILGLWFAVGAALAASQGPDAGSALYRRGAYAEAEAAWSTDFDGATALPERARLAYNLGNAAYRKGEPLRAIAWYVQCLELAPRHAAARKNLALARAEASLQPEDAGSLGAALVRAVGAFTAGEATLVALLGVVCLALALAYEAMRGGGRGRLALLLGFGVLLFALGPLTVHMLRPAGPRAVVVASKPVAGRSEPRSDAKRLGSLKPAAIVSIKDEYLDWSRVRSEGQEFWLPNEALFRLR